MSTKPDKGAETEQSYALGRQVVNPTSRSVVLVCKREDRRDTCIGRTRLSSI